jgi:hypothetical protein
MFTILRQISTMLAIHVESFPHIFNGRSKKWTSIRNLSASVANDTTWCSNASLTSCRPRPWNLKKKKKEKNPWKKWKCKIWQLTQWYLHIFDDRAPKKQ